MKIQIKTDRNLSRDISTMAVINTSSRKQTLASRRKRIEQQNEVSALRQEVNELKELVRKLIKE